MNSPSQALLTFSLKNDWSYTGQGRPWGQRDRVAGTKQADVFYLEIVQPLVKQCTHYLKTRAQGSGSKEGDGSTISALWLWDDWALQAMWCSIERGHGKGDKGSREGEEL